MVYIWAYVSIQSLSSAAASELQLKKNSRLTQWQWYWKHTVARLKLLSFKKSPFLFVLIMLVSTAQV